ncbi:phospholipase D-like domain-containing protein [Streptomyces sp. WM6378]|uniref:phospholipase D-like domain-containing protein n=1 Tax=Streptomyces sp. WM6378 TaxID=1415557 RepID=UPI000A7A4D14|nr:phospholipase D-like domain-containing protein [Streptomyces sp. WM6378]
MLTCFAKALSAHPALHMIAVIPSAPSDDGRLSLPMNHLGRIQALDLLHRAGGDRVAVYSLENHAGTPVYVHAKVCVVDDVWASVGSDNINRRSWTHDSELSCAFLDETQDSREPRDSGGLGDGARTGARDLRLQLAREHLDHSDPTALCDPVTAFRAFAESSAALDAWHNTGRAGPGPPAACARTAPHICHAPPRPWSPPSTGSSPTPTAAPWPCDVATPSERRCRWTPYRQKSLSPHTRLPRQPVCGLPHRFRSETSRW